MPLNFYSFGSEVRFLNTKITTATHKKFDLKDKLIIKIIIHIIGLPHFGARLRAYHLNKLLNKFECPQTILDAGCGIGLNSFLAAHKGFSVTGIDKEKTKISTAKKMLSKSNYKNIRFLQEDLTKMNLKARSFNAVICFEVLEHIHKDQKALREISRILKDKGTLFLSVPGTGFISRINQHHKHHVREGYSLNELQNKLENAGFHLKHIIKMEHSYLGLAIRFLNDEIHKRSLVVTTLLFPFFFLLAIIDTSLPEIITPNNWIVQATKKKTV